MKKAKHAVLLLYRTPRAVSKKTTKKTRNGNQTTKLSEVFLVTGAVYANPFRDRSPVWGTNYLLFEWFAPEMGLRS